MDPSLRAKDASPRAEDDSPPAEPATNSDADAAIDLPNPAPVTLSRLFQIHEIRDTIIRQGDFNLEDLRRLEAAGLRAYVTPEWNRRIRGEVKCDTELNFAAWPRPGLTTGIGQCPCTDIICPRFRLCEGSFEHAPHTGPWDHRFIHQHIRMPPLVPHHEGILHPPSNGRPGAFHICIHCRQDLRYSYGPVNREVTHEDGDCRRAYTENWLPYCEMHSLELSDEWDACWPNLPNAPAGCRCVEDVNRSWSCLDHRFQTLNCIRMRKSAHETYLRKWHVHRPRPRPRNIYRPARGRSIEPTAAALRRERASCYYDEHKVPKKVPGCPKERCPRPPWGKTGEPRRRIAKCGGCGGLVRFRGKLGDLSPA